MATKNTPTEHWPNMIEGQWVSDEGHWADFENEKTIPSDRLTAAIGEIVLSMLKEPELACTNIRLPDKSTLAIYRQHPGARLQIKEIPHAC